MFTGKEAVHGNPAYPTQWALNPSAYQNVDSNSVDWAALAQQWIAMKDAAVILAAPQPPPSKPVDAEEGEAPMEVEGNEGPVPALGEWNAATNTWGGNWNNWGWGWGDGIDPKSDPSMMMGGYGADGTAPMPGYTTGQAPTFQHGYWTAQQPENKDTNRRDRRSKSKNTDRQFRSRLIREKPPIQLVEEPTPSATIDAAKRRQLPGWIREGLEKMEREKQRALERENEMKAREEAEKLRKKFEEEELERMKSEAGGAPMIPAKSKFDTDSEGDESEGAEKEAVPPPEPEASIEPREPKTEPQPIASKSREEIMQEVMLEVRRSLTEILLEVTDSEIHTVSQEELVRYTAIQASRLNAMKASKSKALAAIASGLGLGAYESSSDESGEEEVNEISDQQLQEMIQRRKNEFERTAREIEAEVRRAEAREAGEVVSSPVTTPEPLRSRSSVTPPPNDFEMPEKIADRRQSDDKRNNHKSNDRDRVDGAKRLDTIPEEKKRPTKHRSPTPPNKTSSTTSDSEQDSSSSSSETCSETEPEVKEKQSKKKRKRHDSYSSDSRKKAKKEKYKKLKSYKDDRNSPKHDDYDKSKKKKNDYVRSHKSSKSGRDYERSHNDKYRDESEERLRKRAKRSRSISFESRSGRRRSEERSRRREKRSYDRERSYEKRYTRDRSQERRGYDKERSHERRGYERDKRSSRDRDYDRYERSREHDRRRSRSRSRHRR